MTVQQFRDRLKAIRGEVANDITKVLQIAAQQDLIINIRTRVERRSTNANGQLFGTYSQTKLPPFFFMRNQTLRKKVGVALEAKQKAGEKISYAEVRQLAGNSNPNKNFRFTGDMWSGFGQKSITATSVTIGGETAYAQKVMGYNSEREGINIIKPSDAEIKLVKKRFVDFLFAKIKKTGV
jgi:hypothetical protein